MGIGLVQIWYYNKVRLEKRFFHIMTSDVLGIKNGGSRSGIVDHEESYKQLDEMEQEKKKLGSVNTSN